MISYFCILFIFLFMFNDLTAQLDVNSTTREVKFKLFDKNYQLVDVTDSKIQNNKPLIVFAHGFRCSTKTPIIVAFGKWLTRMTDSNVVLVDWSDWAMQMDYGNLVIQFPTVVPHLADWLNGLHDREIIKTFSDIILIGHSLGAHLVGNAGHRLNGTVSRIIALDPAQPNFRIDHKNERVDVNSGRFVMVLHTSTLLFGLREPVGHVDFYFNGAQFQPTCAVDTTCGHLMSIIYMMDSLKNSTAFPASRCCTVDDCEKKIVDLEKPTVYMNMNTPISTRGLYSILPGRKNLTFYMRLLGYTLKMI